MKRPRMIISALRGGSGKTILSLGILAALQRRGRSVTPFKKGPDYIDAGWLALAAGRPCYNLDTFMALTPHVQQSFLFRSRSDDIAVIEGNRGLYDGIDPEGSTSTAELAKLLRAPVILCVDCTKITRTMAAVVVGCKSFDPQVNISGIVLNRVAGTRHESILRSSIRQHCGVPVVGAIPKLRRQSFPERHMGLVPTPEHRWARDALAAVAQMAEDHLDLERLIEIATTAPPFKTTAIPSNIAALYHQETESVPADPPKIGIIRDSAFQFYYPENIEALQAAGAEIVYMSPLKRDTIPDIDALYIGGGFPETHATELANNVRFREELKARAEDGLPIYAECGGLMYLGREIELEGATYPMSGVLPVVYGLSKRPQGHGYTIVKVDRDNPYYPVGTVLKGHEFHYSKVLQWHGTDNDLAFAMERGAGFINQRDGVCANNVLATYTHLHALGTPAWASAMVQNALDHRKAQNSP